MKFRILHSGESDVKEKAESLSKVLTDKTPKPAFSGILIIHGVEDVQKACLFLQSDFEGTTIFLLDKDFLSLTENRKAFKLVEKIKEYLNPRRNGRVLFINYSVSEEALEEFKKDFDLSENFVQALVHFTDITEIANYVHRLMHYGGRMESRDEPVSLPTGLMRNLTEQALDSTNWQRMSVTSLDNAPPVSNLPSYYLGHNTPDSASGGLHNLRRPMEHYCSLSSDSGSAEGSRQPPVGDSAPTSFNKRSSRSLPDPTSPKPSQDPVTFRSEPAASARPQVMANNPRDGPGQVTRYNSGQATGYSPTQMTGDTRFDSGQVTRYNSGQATGYNPGQATGYNPGQATRYNSGQVTRYNSGQATGYNPGQATGYNPGQATGYNPGQVTGCNPGQATGYSPTQVTGNTRFNYGQVTGYNSGQATGYNPGQMTGYNSGQMTGYNPGQMTGYNPGQITRNNSGQMTGYNSGQMTGNISGHITGNISEQPTVPLVQQRVPEQNLDEEEGFPSEDIFVSNFQQQQHSISNPQDVVTEKYVQPVPNQGEVSDYSNDSGNFSTNRQSGVQFISQDLPSTASEMVTSYVRGDMEHLLDNLGENELPNSLYNSGFCVDCKKSKTLMAVTGSRDSAQRKDFFTDESVPPYSTFGPTALNNFCEDCSQKRQNRKSDSIPSMESSTVNSMILSGASEKLRKSRNSEQDFYSGQRDQQGQRLLQGEGLNQGQMLEGQRSLHLQMSQGCRINQRQMVQGQMSQHQLLNQRQVSQGQLTVQTEMDQIVRGISNIRFQGPRNVTPSDTQHQISGIVHAYTDRMRDPNSEQGQYQQSLNSQNLGRQGFPSMSSYSSSLGEVGLQTISTNPQSEVAREESTMSSDETNLTSSQRMTLPQGMISPQGMPLPQGMISPQGMPLPQGMISPQGMPLPQGMISPQGVPLPQRMTSPVGMTSPQRMNLAQRMTSMPTIQMQESEMNLLSSFNGAGGGISRGLQSLPSNLDSHSAGFLGPNIRQGDPDNHSSLQSETDNRDFDDRLNGNTGPASREDRGTRTSNNTRNTNGQRGRDDGASGGMDPGSTSDAVGAENQVDIHELALPVFEYIRDQLDCAQMYNWRNLAHLHGLNYGQIQNIEQLWKNQRISSPFEYLIRTFERYSVQQLRDDLRKIPRCDLLDRLKKLEIDGKLPAGCAGLFTSQS